MQVDALYPTLALNLGLGTAELAEIAGVSVDEAIRLLRGETPFPASLQQALLDLQDDIDVLGDVIEADVQDGHGAIWMYRDTEELRRRRPDIPGRGNAGGGFIGPYRIAALTAFDSLKENGIDVDIVFIDTVTS